MPAAEDFRIVMRNLALGVTVVTTVFDGRYHGTTVTSLTSVSLDPMLVQFSLDLGSRTREMVERSGIFAVNILSSEQESIARAFALKDLDKFESCSVTQSVSGLPLIAGAIGHLECRVDKIIEAGDHVLFLGGVLGAAGYPGSPLVYFQGSYRQIEEEE